MRVPALVVLAIVHLLAAPGGGTAGDLPAIRASFTVTIPNGFLTGKDFLNMSEGEKNGYVMGFVNGLTVAPLLGATPERFQAVEERMLRKDVTNLEYVDILKEYIAKRPGNLERGLNILSYEAFRMAFNPNL